MAMSTWYRADWHLCSRAAASISHGMSLSIVTHRRHRRLSIGIRAHNYGTGALTIAANGDVAGDPTHLSYRHLRSTITSAAATLSVDNATGTVAGGGLRHSGASNTCRRRARPSSPMATSRVRAFDGIYVSEQFDRSDQHHRGIRRRRSRVSAPRLRMSRAASTNSLTNYGTVRPISSAWVGFAAIVARRRQRDGRTISASSPATSSLGTGANAFNNYARRVVQFRHHGRSRRRQSAHQSRHAVAGRRRQYPHHAISPAISPQHELELHLRESMLQGAYADRART